ncbi:hypothetical protein [Phenylobacterium sp.]|uniref:hypothetical protein n=1 Tax=Phenylobacterium sp. TaxID=1871053 RepID=UPI003562697B
MVSISEAARPRRQVLTAVVTGGLAAGVFDFCVACAESGLPPLTIGKAVARGWFGKAAMHGGTDVALIGIVSHFTIMLAFAAAFVLVSLRAPILRRLFFVTGPLYGAAIFFFMRYVVMPLSAAGFSMPKPPVLYYEFAGHLFLVGLVIAAAARWSLGRD